jgi:hypothetical protein
MERGNAVARFAYEVPSLDSYWRAVVLFGQNVQSYKFALAGVNDGRILTPFRRLKVDPLLVG